MWKQAGGARIAELLAHGGLSQSTHKSVKFAPWQAELDAYFADPAVMFDLPEGAVKFGVRALSKACKKGFDAPVCELAQALDELADQVADALPAGKQRLIALQVALLELNRELPERKAAQRLLAFDDLLNRLDQALQGPVGEDLAASLRATHSLALIDEFRDTDPIQYAIFDRIYAKGRDASLCFVGDPKQAIYASAARTATYMTAKQQADREPFNLPTNYRSTPELDRRAQPAVRPSAAVRPTRPALPTGGCRRQAACEPASGRGGRGGAAVAGLARRRSAGQVTPRSWRPVTPRDGSPCSWPPPPRTRRFRQGWRLRPAQGRRYRRAGGQSPPGRDDRRRAGRAWRAQRRRGRDSVWRSEEAAELAAVLAAYAEPGREGLLRHAPTRLLAAAPPISPAAVMTSMNGTPSAKPPSATTSSGSSRASCACSAPGSTSRRWPKRLLARVDGERRLTNLLHLGELLQAESLLRPGSSRCSPGSTPSAAAKAPVKKRCCARKRCRTVQIVTIHTSKGLEYPLVFCPFSGTASCSAKP